MARNLFLHGVTLALLVASVTYVNGIPLPGNRLSTIADDILSRVFNETRNEVSSGIFDRHIACRACKRLIINTRYALIVDKNEISAYFVAPCEEIYPDKQDKELEHDCQLVIQQKVDKYYNDILNVLNAEYWCKDMIHLCPERSEDTAINNEIPNNLLN